MTLLEYRSKSPTIAEGALVSPNATLIGDVRVGKNSVVWPGSVLRAEYAPIIIGEYCTIFDGAVLFTRSEKSPITTGNYSIIETGATILGCYFEDFVLVSQNCLIHERASIGEGVILLSDSVVPPGFMVESRSILKGDPVQKIREQTRNDVIKHKERAEHFSELFMKIQHQLPNAQSYMLTLTDFMKILLDKVSLSE
ncbi:MAG: gamma carbonic anhydrase family protein [Candidatus Lokiarchaeota archaeon]|nr:gamma carbonic anhydrase family protein [Candidatus Lokiarchaeota archaeon]